MLFFNDIYIKSKIVGPFVSVLHPFVAIFLANLLETAISSIISWVAISKFSPSSTIYIYKEKSWQPLLIQYFVRMDLQ